MRTRCAPQRHVVVVVVVDLRPPSSPFLSSSTSSSSPAASLIWQYLLDVRKVDGEVLPFMDVCSLLLSELNLRQTAGDAE